MVGAAPAAAASEVPAPAMASAAASEPIFRWQRTPCTTCGHIAGSKGAFSTWQRLRSRRQGHTDVYCTRRDFRCLGQQLSALTGARCVTGMPELAKIERRLAGKAGESDAGDEDAKGAGKQRHCSTAQQTAAAPAPPPPGPKARSVLNDSSACLARSYQKLQKWRQRGEKAEAKAEALLSEVEAL